MTSYNKQKEKYSKNRLLDQGQREHLNFFNGGLDTILLLRQ